MFWQIANTWLRSFAICDFSLHSHGRDRGRIIAAAKEYQRRMTDRAV
jgi:hypothetical protein